MCGISGHLGTNFIKSNSLSKTLNLMKVRGPDNQSHMKFNLSNDINLNLLHSRLNIIDLNTRSNQPMKFNDNIIVFNGEIYNYLELKKKLQSKGYSFKTLIA